MENVIERLKRSVKFAEESGGDMDERSWGMQEGVLISENEAKNFIAAFEALEEVVRISDRNHVAWDKAKAAINKAYGITD